MDLICAVKIPGKKPGERIGIVKFYEAGYYPTFLDRAENNDAQTELVVDAFNEGLGIPPGVAESAADGSMFGWHTPAAQAAIEFFKEKSLLTV